LIIVALLAAILPLFPTDLSAATISINFTNNGEPLDDPQHGKFYVYDAEDEERESYLAWGHADKTVTLPEGVYSVVVRYVNDEIRRERVIEEIELRPDDEVELDMAFNIPVATLTLNVTSDGRPVVPGSARYSLYPAGRRDKPRASKRPGSSMTIEAGTYDIEVSHHSLQGLQTKWLENYRLEGVREETVEMGRSAASLRLTVMNEGRVLESSAARWIAYAAGKHERALAESSSGEGVTLKPGSYDIAIFYDLDGKSGRRWLNGVDIYGNVHREVDLAELGGALTVDIRHRGRSLPGAWYTIHPAGDRGVELASAGNGFAVELEPGIYDIGCFYRDGGVRSEKWLSGRKVAGPSELDVELEFEPASLRVSPRRGREPEGNSEETNILLLLDSSGAMAEALGVRSRMELVQAVLPDQLAGIASSRLNVALRVYGIAPRSRRDCGDSTLLAPLGRADRPLIAQSIENLRPTGFAPIAYSLRHAAADLPAGGNNAIVLITGSLDTCGGDLCSSAAELLRSATASRIYVVALGERKSAVSALDCVGQFHAVATGAELKSVLRDIFRSALRMDLGVVSLFEGGGGDWVAAGALRERIEVTSGNYDVLIRAGSKEYSWQGLEITGDMEAEARERAPRGD
jgi:hypothetical protein